MTDWVICAPAKVSYRAASGLMPQPSGFGEASATCPATTRLVGGGVRVPEFGPTQRDVDVRPTIFSPFDGADGDSLPDDGWQVEADDWGAGGDLSIQSTAICLH
jgi:hypothetical protein